MARSISTNSMLLLGLLGAPLAAGLVGACSAGDEGGSSDRRSTGNGPGGDDDDLFGSGGATAGLAFTMEPAEATITVQDGVATPASVQFTAKHDGAAVVGAAWTVDSGAATVDAHGVATATGIKGGLVHVTAEEGSDKGVASLKVVLAKTSDAVGVSAADRALLEAASEPDASTVWAYPYDGTVFPLGLGAPELMWDLGLDGDVYRIELRGDYVEYVFFVHAASPSRFLMDEASWVEITESAKGGPLRMKVARLAAGAKTATVVADHEWKIAKGSLRGTVYYWANSLGSIVRIKPGASAPEDFLGAAGVDEACSSCHTVSANGQVLVIGGDVSASTYDLLNDAVVMDGKGRDWTMPAVSPEGKYLVENCAPIFANTGKEAGLFEAATGELVPGTGLDTCLDMPAFGPAGKHLAYVAHDAPYDLGVFSYDPASVKLSDSHTLVQAGSDPTYDCIAYPSVSPTTVSGKEVTEEATWIVYHRGTYPDCLDTRDGPADLFLASADTAGIEVRLAALNGDEYPFAAGDRDRHLNYEPTFAPANAGGYAWVVFTSRRTYGNRLTGAENKVKQLWVAAIDQFPVPGEDPSHPAFWVPGQDVETLNMRAFWALDPCVQQGKTCNGSGQCCDGHPCEDGLCGGPKQCAPEGGFCETKADCCDPSAECLGGECGEPPS